MAHLSVLCELPVRIRAAVMIAYAGFRRADWRNWIMADCPLCGACTAGGALCPACHDIVTHSMRSAAWRCRRCCVMLDGADRPAGPVCQDCLARPPAFDRIIAAFDYVAPADMLIHRFKVAQCFADAPMLGGLLADAVVRADYVLPDGLLVTPVPASRQALLRRGFNPAAEIARVLARRLGRPCRPDVLLRHREGRKQAEQGRERRMMGASHLYQVGVCVRGAHIAVVDDVLTTGSTLHSVARLLKRAGAASVHGLVLARTPVV